MRFPAARRTIVRMTARPLPAPAPVLQALGVVKRFGGVAALDGVSLAVAAGECVAVVGESGSGKTTLLRCFNRLVEPDGGRILLEGEDARRADPVALRRRIGYVPQDGGLLPHWPVLRNVALVPWLCGDGGAERKAADALALVGLEPAAFAARWPRELSGGQRQRVALARALAGAPAIVLLDEPFGALDAITRADLQEMFARVRRELAAAALLVTHDLHEALALGDRIVVLRGGRVEQDAPADALVARPATDYVRRLLERSRVIR
ncbi:MAG TPA: ATP-binding cassette domain-containing protein [Gemmatimonadales bacterium]|nr:ATP-binding cassette domain-containing protein [Gemmatimonadales bacterium]